MINDILKIDKPHADNANIISFFVQRGEKFVVSIGGESGSGKSETAESLKQKLDELGITSVVLQLDDYFKLPPKTNADMRKSNFNHVGINEVDLELLDKHIAMFKDGVKSFEKPLIIFDKNVIVSEIFNCEADVLIVEGTYTLFLNNVDFKVYIEDSEVEKRRLIRNREKQDAFLEKVLKKEKSILVPKKQDANLVLVDGNLEIVNFVKNIAMFSVHGYFDLYPELGKIDTGGQIIHILELSKKFAKFNINVDIFTRLFDSEKDILIDSYPGIDNLRLIKLKCGPNDFVRKEDIYQYLDEYVDNVKSYIDKNEIKYDIIHGHYADGGYVAEKIAEYYDIPMVFTGHSLGAWKKERLGDDKLLNYDVRIPIETNAMKFSKYQTAYNPMQIEKTKQLYNINENIELIPSGVNVDLFNENFEFDNSINLPEKFIFCFSRLDKTKGIIELVKAFAVFNKKYKSDYYLVIGGGSKVYTDNEFQLLKEVFNIASSLGVLNKIIFVGNIENKLTPNYYLKCDFFVLPSISELMGMTAQEAMCCGKLALVSKYAGVVSIVKHLENAIVIDPNDTEEFAKYMFLASDLNDYKKLISNNGKKLMVEQFSWLAISYKYLNVYFKCKR